MLGISNRMAERIAAIFQKSFLLCLFSVTTVLFIISWFFVLRSAEHPRFLDRSLLSNSKLLAFYDSGNVESQSQNNGGRSNSYLPTAAIGEALTTSLECNSHKVVLKVFMYDLPPEFHFELLDWKSTGENVWPDIRKKLPEYPGGLNLQHSIEYWLTLDLLASEFSKSSHVHTAVRVQNSSEADVIFVPFFSSLSYNRHSKINQQEKTSRNKVLQDKLMRFLTAREEWKRSGGRDHIILAHHPNSLLDARMKLWPAMFILADFGRYSPSIANADKDVIAPYKHIVRAFVNDSSDFESRLTLLYFQGSIYRKDGGSIRQELFYLLKDEKDVHFQFGSVQGNGINKAMQGMQSSKFCLNIAGDTPSSNRLFDAIASHCVPVIISDEIELPYEDILDYSEFCLFVRSSDALKANFIIELVRSIGMDKWTRMWNRLKEVEHLFEFQYPSKEDDAVQMIWQAVARKVPAVRLRLHKSKRFSSYAAPKDRSRVGSVPMPKSFQE